MLCVVAGVVAMVVGKRSKRMSVERKREMIEHARDNDMSVDEAAKHFAVSRMMIARAATALRIELKSGRGTAQGKRKTDQEKKEKFLKSINLTPEEFERFRESCNTVYHTLGGDWAEAGVKSMSRKQLMELVCDSDNLRIHGNAGRRSGREPVQPSHDEFIKTKALPLLRLPEAKFRTLTKMVFPYGRYDT